MITPKRIQNNGIELNKPNDDLTITVTTTDGLDINYDLNSAPKEFKLNENGVYWTNGVQTFQTSLNRLINNDNEDKNHPYRTIKTVEKVRQSLINKNITPKT